MKQASFSRNYALLFVLATFLSAHFSACKKDSESCGAAATWMSDIDENENLVGNEYDIDANRRKLYYEDLTLPQNICSKMPAHVAFNIQSDYLADTDVRAIIMGSGTASFMYERTVLMDYSASVGGYRGEFDMNDLQLVFDGVPAELYMQFILDMPSSGAGSVEQDTAYVNNAVQSMSIELEYHKTAP